jgi:hypothetical protein
MKQSKWPDFLFTITVRFVFGILLGGLACLFFSWRGDLRAFSHDNTHAPLIWLGLWGLVGGIVAVVTVPRWQTPWYRRDSSALDLSAELASASQDDGTNPGSNVVTKKSVTIKIVREGGEQHEYSSMEEVPPEIRSEIEALEKEIAHERGSELSVTETSQTGDAITSKIICRKNISVYKIIDDSGVERTYHSLEEMPPDIRAAIAEAENKSKN